MEKFSLKWNDFEANASKSFRNLRAEEHFFDVTLVSDDEHLLSAHKLVLSASSDFFKNILRKSTHSSPLVYLPGVKSAVLNSIIDSFIMERFISTKMILITFWMLLRSSE